MKLHYYPETHSLYVELADRPGFGTCPATDTVNFFLDANGGIVGIYIDRASQQFDLSTLQTSALPVPVRDAA